MTYAIGPYGPAGLEPGSDARVMREGQALLETYRFTLAAKDGADPWFARALVAAEAGMEAGTRAAFREAGRNTSTRMFWDFSGWVSSSARESMPSPALVGARHLHGWFWAYGREAGSGRFGCRICGRLTLSKLGIGSFCWVCGWRHAPTAEWERRENGTTPRVACERFKQIGAINEDLTALLRAPFLCELPDDRRARKWIAVDTSELAGIRDRLERAHRALVRRDESRHPYPSPAPLLNIAVRHLRAHEVWAGVGQFELFGLHSDNDEAATAYRRFVGRAEEYLRALGQRLSRLPLYSCDACDAPTIHSPGYPCRHCGWYPAKDVDLPSARDNVARYGRIQRMRMDGLRPLYSFETEQLTSRACEERPLPAILDAERKDTPEPARLIERATVVRPRAAAIHMAAKSLEDAKKALACTYAGRVIDVAHDVEARVVVISFAMIGLYWSQQIGPKPRLVQVGAIAREGEWYRSEGWRSPALRGRITIGGVREVIYQGDADGEATTWVLEEEDGGYVVDVHHNIRVRTDAIAVAVDVDSIVLGTVIIDTTYTMEDKWQSTSFYWNL